MITMLKSSTGSRCRLQKNGTPRIKPIRSGGSPIGVRQPPMLDTIKIKKITMWRLLFLHAFILMIGRIIYILAPVVPIQLDNRVPSARSPTLILGEPARSPDRVILPDTQNNPKRRTMNVR